MPEFEYKDRSSQGGNPFKNKKLQPFLIGGVVLIVVYVVLKKATGSNQTGTAYQGTYATNTGTTTEVSNMMEQYKSAFDDSLATQQDMVDSKLEA